ncbi:unannotated protein [freshwater metagenome]|uniref:Unannotated protein n=1 Tax=freshwater metagenome TaxID=449393 RepID=A0A6J6YT60_9ZZZZ
MPNCRAWVHRSRTAAVPARAALTDAPLRQSLPLGSSTLDAVWHGFFRHKVSFLASFVKHSGTVSMAAMNAKRCALQAAGPIQRGTSRVHHQSQCLQWNPHRQQRASRSRALAPGLICTGCCRQATRNYSARSDAGTSPHVSRGIYAGMLWLFSATLSSRSTPVCNCSWLTIWTIQMTCSLAMPLGLHCALG